jgi:hypothetical protein
MKSEFLICKRLLGRNRARSTRSAEQAGAVRLTSLQSTRHGTARCGSLAAKPRQGVHRKLSQPTAHTPDTVESSSSK